MRATKSTSYNYNTKFEYSRKAYFFEITDKIVQNSELYTYQFSLNGSYSDPFDYTYIHLEPSDSFKVFWIADMDVSSNSTNTRNALKGINWPDYSMLMHSGDVAYEIEDDNGFKGDKYFENQSENNKLVPYQLIPGNHENFDKGNLLNYRFRMPVDPTLNTQINGNHYYTVV